MDDFETALQNIDIFCKVLVKKIIGDENEPEKDFAIEPLENLIRRKYTFEEHLASSPLSKSLIPLPQADEPLIDVFEDDNYVRVLMQCRCRDQKVTVLPDVDGLKICKRECHLSVDGTEICTDKCQKLDIPTKHLQIEDITAKCSNNAVFEVNIPKTKNQ
jgi:hypothetical protein